MKMEMYVSPEVEVLEVMVEKGYEASAGGQTDLPLGPGGL